MVAVVTGGAGFIGSHVADACLARGYDTLVVDNLATGKRENIPEGARFIELDIRDRDAVDRLIAEVKPGVIFHQAAQAALRSSVEDPWYDLSVNLIGSLNIIHAAKDNGVRKIVYASSGGACYGPFAPPYTTEDFPVQPNSPYGVTKHSVEHYLWYYERNFGLSYVALRYANIYGPRQDSLGEAGVVAIFSRAVLEGRRPEIFGDGTQTRDYVYVTDVARANLLAADSEASGEVNIATGIETSVSEILALIQAAAGTEIEPIYGEPRIGDLQRCVLDSRRAAEVLGWRPTVALADGIADTVAWVRASLAG